MAGKVAEIYAFPDANVFLEFKDFAEIDWRDLLQAKNVVLLITYPVLREIDKHKHDRGRTRDRAISVTRRIAEMTDRYANEAKVRDGVTLRLAHRDVNRAKVVPPLDPESFDDHILVVVSELKEEVAIPVVFVTDDSVAEAKARTLGLPVVSMPDELRLPPEPTEGSRQLKRLQERVDALESKIPQLAIFLRTNGELVTRASFSVQIPRDPTEQHFEAKIRELRTYHQHIVTRLQERKGGLGLASLMYRQPTAEEIVKYEQEAGKYVSEYRRYLAELVDWERIAGREMILRFVITNSGFAPAENTRVILRFPDEVEVDEKPMPKLTPPKEPNPPSTLSPVAELLHQPRLDIQSLVRAPRLPSGLGANPGTPIIRKGRSTEVQFGPRAIMHGFQWQPSPVWIMLPERRKAFELVIPYKAHAANLPVPVEATVTIAVEYKQVDPWTISAGREEEVEE